MSGLMRWFGWTGVLGAAAVAAAGDGLIAPVAGAGGTLRPDGSVFVVGQVAAGAAGGGGVLVELGTVPCWLEAAACVGDVNGDGVVDLDDLLTTLANFGTPSGAGLEDGDTDGDGDVDFDDLLTLLGAFGTLC